MEPLAVLALGYVLGSIPFGLLLTRMAGGGDIRAIGSGNIGATKWLAALTLLLDGAKGAAAVLIGEAILPGGALLGAAGAFFGHLYPVWLRFRGGKGVATFLGIVLAMHWPCGLIFAAVWLGALLAFRYSSVAGMMAAVSAPVSASMWGEFNMVLLFIAFAMLVLWKHRGNIERLLAGTEPKVGQTASG
ncbi:MAG: acyl-phosphate glycerol 3-phosphate acyltransferase [Sphingomonas sp. SCN 67-18]|nr:MAG: acyl-phosphate glycerol 3-phosphate acyltransferase [Sphingomonas sp. SCN 67-18]